MKKKYRTYRDLKMYPHPGGLPGYQAIEHFPNGYGVSVVRFSSPHPEVTKAFGRPFLSYCNTADEWEMAVLHFRGPGPRDFDLVYDTPVADDVIGYCKARDVTRIMKQVQDLPRRKDGN